jgi:VCBS repeat-containing protein
VSGSAQLVNANYTYGHIDRNVNNPNAVLDTRSVGSVGWSTPNGATWGYLQAGLSSANIGTTYTQISNAGRLYASELILARPAAVAADPTAGDDLAWNFASGSSGNGAFNFLPAGRTLELSYTARATDSSTPAGSTDRAIVLTLTGTNDAPTDIALSAAVVAENAASGTAVGTFSTSDVDVGDTFTYSLVSGTGDTDNASFQIVGGQLRTNASFDFETKSSYSIRVRSTDQSNAAFEKQFTISVTDVNEAPTITVGSGDSASASLTETNAALTAGGTLSVTDTDLTDVVTVTVPAVVASGTTTGLAANNAALLAMFTVNNPNTVITGPATTGTITWAFNSGSETFGYVAAGETLTLTYTVRVTDAASATADQSVTITITGTNDAPVISLRREIQETNGLGLTNDNRTYSFYSPENGSAEYGVAVSSGPSGFASAAALAAAFQANPNYGLLPYTISVNGAGTQLVLTFKTDGDFGQRRLERWGDHAVPLTVVQDGGADTVTLAETNASLTAAGTFAVEDLDRTNTVTVTVPTVVASGTTTGLTANNAALLAMFTVNNPNTVISSTATTGTINWAFNSGSETFDYVAAGETLTLTYTVRVTDSASVTADRLVTVTITGTQDLPVLAVATGSTATGSATETDTTLAC